ncbi:MAG: phosphoglycerate dehydrogenase [Phycisphaerales bacterium]|nr:phosphoglycerate dehydrogenase [Phycisphaerales bacterium]
MSTTILIADKLAPEGAAFLASQDGVAVIANTGLTDDALYDALAAADGVVVRSAVKLTEDVLRKTFERPGCRLRGIARAGVGVDNIHLPTATALGVAVMNSASASTITTAEHAFALLIALARNVAASNAVFRGGGWGRSDYVGVQLSGRTLGIVGMGRIGQAMAHRAIAFGMQVLGFDPFMHEPTALEGQVRMLDSFDEMIEQVDAVTFHVPKTDQTLGMLGRDQFAMCRAGLLVVNAARGGIVDEVALIEALDQRKCAGAAIDVYQGEPPPEDHPFRSHPRVLATPHLGASTVEAQEAVAVDACAALLRYLQGEGLDGAVNAGGLDLELDDRQKAFVDLASRMIPLLATVTDLSAADDVNVELHGPATAGKGDTIARYALVELLQRRCDEPVSIINVSAMAVEQGVTASTTIGQGDAVDSMAIHVNGDAAHSICGTVHSDGRPRVTDIDGHALDMVPEGNMVVLFNEDRPGMIGQVGAMFGASGINIAEMVIGRSEGASEAMMVIKADDAPSEDLLDTLRGTEGIKNPVAVAISC